MPATMITVILAAAAALSAMIAPAYAYIDPGTGSIILQGIIGGVAGGLFILRTYWAKVTAFFGGARKAEKAAADRGADA